MRRLILIILAAPIGLFQACSFPDVSFEKIEAGPDSTVPDPMQDATTDAPPDARRPPSDVDPEGGTRDAATRGDAMVQRPDASDAEAGPVGCGSVGGTPCDCDDDQGPNSAPGCGATAETVDCDDFDPLVHRQQDFVAASWDPRSPHVPANDWNCDGEVTKQFDYGIKCSLVDCTQGFGEDVPCGATGTYNICKPALNVLGLLTLCSVGSTEQRVQGCK